MTTVNPNSVSRQAHVQHVATLVTKGDMAAAAMLAYPSLMAQDYIPFLEHQATLAKATLVEVLEVVSKDDLEKTRRQIPKDCPEKARLAAASKAMLSTRPTTWTLYDIGQLTIAKAPSKFACLVAEPVQDGKVAKHIKGLPFWRFIRDMTDEDRATLASLLDEADEHGMA